VEGEGIAPDIEIFHDPEEIAEGSYPLLERAVQEALKLLQNEGIKLKLEPAAHVRFKRPG
jgi:tricorn protease